MSKEEIEQFLCPFVGEMRVSILREDGALLPFRLQYSPSLGNDDACVLIVPLEPL